MCYVMNHGDIIPCATVGNSTLVIPHRVPQAEEEEEERKSSLIGKKKKAIFHDAVWIGPEGHPTQACGNQEDFPEGVLGKWDPEAGVGSSSGEVEGRKNTAGRGEPRFRRQWCALQKVGKTRSVTQGFANSCKIWALS